MAATEKKYRRLPGRGVRGQGVVSVTGVRSRLYLAQDHLLGVDSSWFSEDYKRFYFRDIQGFIIRRTLGAAIINIIISVFAFPTVVMAIGLRNVSGWNIFWWIVAGIFLAFLAVNVWLGPTCVCHIKTAVQIDELPSLGRVHRARKVLARVRPLIIAAQGEFSPGAAAPAAAESAHPPSAAAVVPETLAPAPGDSEPG